MKLPEGFEFSRKGETDQDSTNIWWMHYFGKNTGWYVCFTGTLYVYDIVIADVRRDFTNLKVAQVNMVDDFKKHFKIP